MITIYDTRAQHVSKRFQNEGPSSDVNPWHLLPAVWTPHMHCLPQIVHPMRINWLLTRHPAGNQVCVQVIHVMNGSRHSVQTSVSIITNKLVNIALGCDKALWSTESKERVKTWATHPPASVSGQTSERHHRTEHTTAPDRFKSWWWLEPSSLPTPTISYSQPDSWNWLGLCCSRQTTHNTLEERTAHSNCFPCVLELPGYKSKQNCFAPSLWA